MVRRSIALAFALTLALAAGASAHRLDLPSGAPPATPCNGCGSTQVTTSVTFVVSGHGWGHGVGMSQYGALGYAQNGATFDQILAHFYPGTALGPAPAGRVRVLLAEGKKSLTVSSDVPFQVTDGDGTAHPLPAGVYQLGPGLKLKLDAEGEPAALPGPLSFAPGSSPLALLGHPYRGSLQVSVWNGKLQAVNTVGLAGYLYGVVPSEMPYFWSAEALKAQAVAARSYALATRKTGGFDLFDLYADDRSQVYRGIQAETPETNAAVDATAGQVLLYNGRVATTFFFSTSGGRTAAVTDVFPGLKPVSYLVSVSDPYDSLSPYHDWGPVVVPAAKAAKALRVPGRLLDLTTTPNASGRVATVTALGPLAQLTIPAADVRRALGLRSTWFSVGVLSLSRPAGPLTYGSKLKLTGLARGLTELSLEQRPAASSWQPAAPIAPAADGTFAAVVKPLATTEYRLTTGAVTGAVVRVPVAPLVRFYETGDPTTLRGMARPLVAGATVEVQRLDGAAWTTVADAILDANGDFEVTLALEPGTYRARLAPGHGLVPGTTPPLQVPST